MVQMPVLAEDNTEPVEPAAHSCPEGRTWNKSAEACLNPSDHSRVNEKQKMCDSKADGPEKDECTSMVKSFAADQVGEAGEGITGSETGIKAASAVSSVVIAYASGGIKAGIGLVQAGWNWMIGAEAAATTESVFCYSAMLSLAIFVMSLLNSSNLKKQVKETLKVANADLKRLVAESKKGDGVKYEMQIKLMQAYKKSLEGAEEAAKMRKDGYKQEMTMLSIVLAAALIEMMITQAAITAALATTPVGTAALVILEPRLVCTYWTAGAAAVSLGFTTVLVKHAAKAESKYGDNAEKIGKVLNKYMAFFQKRHTDRTSFLTSMATSNRGAGAVTSISPNDGDAQSFKNTSLTEGEKKMCNNSPNVGCCNDSGKTCPSFSISMAPPAISSAINKADLNGAFERADSRLQGSLNVSDPNVSLAIDKDLRRARAFKKRVLDQLIGKLPAGKAELFDENKQFKAYLKKNFGNENYQFTSDFGANMALGGDKDRFRKLMNEGDTPKELQADKNKLTNSLASLSTVAVPKFKMPKGMDLDLDDEDLESDSSLTGGDMNGGLAADEEYVINKPEIVNKPEVSIFQVISNRYNVLRISKRFGKRVRK